MVPLMHFQYQSTRKQAILQPEIKALREKYSARDRATQEMLQAEMMLYMSVKVSTNTLDVYHY